MGIADFFLPLEPEKPPRRAVSLLLSTCYLLLKNSPIFGEFFLPTACCEAPLRSSSYNFACFCVYNVVEYAGVGV